MRYTRAIELHDAYAFGDALPPSAPIQTRCVADVRLTPQEAWAAFIGEDVSVLGFFELHKGTTIRGYVMELLSELPLADRTTAADLVITYARSIK